MSKQPMSVEERLQFVEFLLDAVIWGPYLDDREHRQKIASQLYICVDASKRHQAHPPAVQDAILRFADGLADIDNIPDTLKPTLRPFVPLSDDSEQ